ncbi:MAG: hypothetical protein ACLVL7_07790 [Anaerotruncus massiliensis (ex Togo et al. 2019)]
MKLAACEDLYDELEFVASRICALVREEGCRYRDIAVIGRDLDRYLVPLETVFTRYEIPFFADLRADIQVHRSRRPAGHARRGAQRVPFEHLLASPKLRHRHRPGEAGELENYCFVWGSRTRRQADFYQQPTGCRRASPRSRRNGWGGSTRPPKAGRPARDAAARACRLRRRALPRRRSGGSSGEGGGAPSGGRRRDGGRSRNASLRCRRRCGRRCSACSTYLGGALADVRLPLAADRSAAHGDFRRRHRAHPTDDRPGDRRRGVDRIRPTVRAPSL